jgi:hypothetical protein
MQEREELRALKREIKMSREGKVKRKICVWKEKKEKKKREERMKEKKKKKKRKEEDWQERYEVDKSSER